MTTLVDNEEPGLSKADCLEYLRPAGERRFKELMETGQQRLGQAWFNSLSVDDQDKLRGSYFDPFHRTGWPDVMKALRFLLEN